MDNYGAQLTSAAATAWLYPAELEKQSIRNALKTNEPTTM